MKEELDQLWESIIQNDIWAFEKLYKKAYSPLLHYADTIIFNHTLAEEAVQDVFIKLWQKRSTILVTGSFKSYLFRSVHNQALNLLRQQELKKESVNALCSEKLWKFIENNYEMDDNALDQIYMGELEEVVKSAVDSLPEKCQKVFFMSRYALMSNEEIAHKLKLSEHTVKSHIYRSLQKISDVLKKNL
jgi:RNA polymerase sigma-70 factor (ECF subfamily)